MTKSRAPGGHSPAANSPAAEKLSAISPRTTQQRRRSGIPREESGERARVDRREEILRAARIVLLDRGYEATTVSEIVGRAGVAQGTFYLYFPSKRALILALTELMFATLTRAAEAAEGRARTFAEAVRGIVSASFEQAAGFRDVMDIVRSCGDGPAEAAGAEPDQQQPYVSFFIGFVERWQRRGAVDSVVDPVLSGGILGALVGQTISRLYARYEDAPPATHVEEVARIVLRALEATRS